MVELKLSDNEPNHPAVRPRSTPFIGSVIFIYKDFQEFDREGFQPVVHNEFLVEQAMWRQVGKVKNQILRMKIKVKMMTKLMMKVCDDYCYLLKKVVQSEYEKMTFLHMTPDYLQSKE